MKNKKLFDETVDILVKAYMNETLVHSTCAACAVGNIIGQKLYGQSNIPLEALSDADHWGSVFGTLKHGKIYRPSFYKERAKKQIDSTGYNLDELIKIEAAFESIKSNDKDGYKGLMVVVDVLCEIHECEDIKEETKELFIK